MYTSCRLKAHTRFLKWTTTTLMSSTFCCREILSMNLTGISTCCNPVISYPSTNILCTVLLCCPPSVMNESTSISLLTTSVPIWSHFLLSSLCLNLIAARQAISSGWIPRNNPYTLLFCWSWKVRSTRKTEARLTSLSCI